MNLRFLLLFGAVSMAAAQTAPPAPVIEANPAPAAQAAPAAPQAPQAGPTAVEAPVIRFEDAGDKAGIHFTHSFGSRQLGSLLEGTGAGSQAPEEYSLAAGGYLRDAAQGPVEGVCGRPLNL